MENEIMERLEKISEMERSIGLNVLKEIVVVSSKILPKHHDLVTNKYDELGEVIGDYLTTRTLIATDLLGYDSIDEFLTDLDKLIKSGNNI